MTSAEIGANTFTYGFGAQDSSCGSAANMNPDSGKNSNRTSQTVNSVTTTYCYDYADRLVSSSDPTANYTEYDTHGNMSYIGTSTKPLRLCYDASDRNYCLVNYDSSTNGDALYYGRDVTDRITYREHNTISTGNWNMDAQYWYGYTGEGSGSSFIRDANWDIVEKTLQLPGGVMLTIKPQESQANDQKQYSMQSVLGRTLLTANAAGTNTSNGNGPASSFTYDPFGNKLPGSSLPSNGPTPTASYAYVGQHQKLTESNLTTTPIQMGARVYLPGIGRFLQVDPVEGGTENNYVYPADPVNETDLNGMWGWSNVKKWGRDRYKSVNNGWKRWERNRDNFYAKHPRVKDTLILIAGARGGKGGIKWKGNELNIGKKLRVAPYGNPGKRSTDGSKKKWAARLPHWHYKTSKWGGKKHRPWQTTFKRWFR